jgi:hypothetical protein
MKSLILKIISGGQTGADMGGLLAGKKLEIRTGGCAPKGFLTENGSNYDLSKIFGLHQSDSEKYPPRTAENISKSDCTIIFSSNTGAERGSILTQNLCLSKKKPHLWIDPKNPNIEEIREFIADQARSKSRPIILNVAVNRESKSPGIESRVQEILVEVLNKA